MEISLMYMDNQWYQDVDGYWCDLSEEPESQFNKTYGYMWGRFTTQEVDKYLAYANS